MRHTKSEAFIQPQGGVCLHDSERHPPTGSRGLLDERFHHSVPMPRPRKAASTNSWPRNRASSLTKLCSQPLCVPFQCYDPDLRYLPLPAEASGLSIHVQVCLFDNLLHCLDIETRTITEIFGAGRSERGSRGKMGRSRGKARVAVTPTLEVKLLFGRDLSSVLLHFARPQVVLAQSAGSVYLSGAISAISPRLEAIYSLG